MIEYRDMTFKQTIKYIPVRIVGMVSKLLGMKGIVLFLTYVLFQQRIIPEEAIGYVWIAIVLITVFGEKALEFFKNLKK